MEKNKDQTIRIIADYFSSKGEISAVFLFGSYAQGRAQQSSDVDVAILFNSSDRIFILNRLDHYHPVLSRLLRKAPHLIALNLSGELLLKQIFSKGRCLLVNNPKQLAAFKMTAFAKIADFGFYKPNLEKAFTRKLMHG